MTIVVLGAGISGLTLAWRLVKNRRRDVVVLEKSARPGGWIKTTHRDGFLFEGGPRSLRCSGNGNHTLTLIEELGLKEELIFAPKHAHKRFLWHGGAVRAVPSSLFEVVVSPRWLTMTLQGVMRDIIAARCSNDDETVAAFFRRRLGTTVTRNIIDPMVLGIYGGDLDKLSMRSCFPDLWNLEQKNRSLALGVLFKKRTERQSPVSSSSLFTLRKGLQTLIDALANRLEKQISYNSTVAKIKPLEDGRTEVCLQNGDVIEAKELYSTLPAYTLAHAVEEHNPRAASLLSQLPYASITSVQLGWHDNVLKKEGFGYLVPRHAGEGILGAVFDSSAFPQQNGHADQTRLTVMMKDDNDPITTALSALKRHLHIDKAPDFVEVTTAQGAIPQYAPFHHRWKEEVACALPYLRLHGTAFCGVSVNDCIANGCNCYRS